MRTFLKSAGIAGLVLAAGLGLAETASAATWVSVGDGWGWGWHRPYWGWGEPVVPVPEPIYVRPEPVYVPVAHSEPRLDYILSELDSRASQIAADRTAGRISGGSYQTLMAEDDSIRAQAIHAADVHRGLPDVPYYHIQSEVQGLSHDISEDAS